MDPDNLQQAWQSQMSNSRVTIDTDVLLRVVQREQQSFRAAIRLGDVVGLVITLVLLPAWMYFGMTTSAPWTWYLTIPVLLWWIVFSVVYRMRHPQQPGKPDEPLVRCIERSLTEIDNQIWYQSKSFWWSSSPIFATVVAFAFHSAWIRSRDGLDLLGHMHTVVFFFAMFYFVYFLNQKWGCAKYEPRRKELLTLLSNLRDETSDAGDDADSSTVRITSPEPSTARAVTIVGGLFAVAVGLGVFGDILDASQRGDGNRATTSATLSVKRSPFAAVRWQGYQPEVMLDEEWFKLVSLNGLPVADIVAFSQKTERSKWRNRFEEDLVELLTNMGHPPKEKVTLVVRSLTTDETSIREDVPMTEENRSAIRDAAQNRSGAATER